MDLNNLLEATAAQGAMFWAASTAVALGLTLIIAAAFAQTRRLKRTVAVPARATPDPSVDEPADLPEAAPVSAQPTPAAGAGGAEEAQIRRLLARVRRMAATVEAHGMSTRTPVFEPDESLLKDTEGDVEYIYRAEKG